MESNSKYLTLKKKTIKTIVWIFIFIAIGYWLFSSQSIELLQNQDNLTNSTSEIAPNLTMPIDSFSYASYPHWDHMPLSYQINNTCDIRLINLVKLAFSKIENETEGLVYYVPTNNTPDIIINCEAADYSTSDKFFKQAIEDTTCITDTTSSNIISHAQINIYGQGAVCDTGYPAVEVHELLHSLGFVHSPHTNSIMYPFFADSSSECKITHIDPEYISCLDNTYSNGSVAGSCQNIDTIINAGDSNFTCYACPNDWYDVKGTFSCCPYPNMVVNNGNCENV